jgi:hypothetical protein
MGRGDRLLGVTNGPQLAGEPHRSSPRRLVSLGLFGRRVSLCLGRLHTHPLHTIGYSYGISFQTNCDKSLSAPSALRAVTAK